MLELSIKTYQLRDYSFYYIYFSYSKVYLFQHRYVAEGFETFTRCRVRPDMNFQMSQLDSWGCTCQKT